MRLYLSSLAAFCTSLLPRSRRSHPRGPSQPTSEGFWEGRVYAQEPRIHLAAGHHKCAGDGAGGHSSLVRIRLSFISHPVLMADAYRVGRIDATSLLR